jgi:hypothetical protein
MIPAVGAGTRPAMAGQTHEPPVQHLAAFSFSHSSNLLLSCGGDEAGVMFDYDITTMRIESASVFFRRLTYALFIGWAVYGVYLFFMGD